MTQVESLADGARLQVETPAGRYAIEAAYLVDASGAHSAVREALGER